LELGDAGPYSHASELGLLETFQLIGSKKCVPGQLVRREAMTAS
jgi:hypothetical protein